MTKERFDIHQHITDKIVSSIALTLMINTPGQAQTEAAKAAALHSSSQVSDAPGKGILPMISGHMAAGFRAGRPTRQKILLQSRRATIAEWRVISSLETRKYELKALHGAC
jgi:hypothetical protein